MQTTATTIEGFDETVADFSAMPGRLQKATVRSLNRAIVSGQATVARLMAKDTGLKVRDIKSAFVLSQATDTNPSASVGTGFKRLPLIQFNAKGPEPSRGAGNGITYTLQGGRNTIPNAFIAVMTNGHRGVFVRARKARLPIKELMGPSLGKVFLKFQDAGQDRADEAFLANFEHELGRMGLNASEILGESDDNADAAD